MINWRTSPETRRNLLLMQPLLLFLSAGLAGLMQPLDWLENLILIIATHLVLTNLVRFIYLTILYHRGKF